MSQVLSPVVTDLLVTVMHHKPIIAPGRARAVGGRGRKLHGRSCLAHPGIGKPLPRESTRGEGVGAPVGTPTLAVDHVLIWSTHAREATICEGCSQLGHHFQGMLLAWKLQDLDCSYLANELGLAKFNASNASLQKCGCQLEPLRCGSQDGLSTVWSLCYIQLAFRLAKVSSNRPRYCVCGCVLMASSPQANPDAESPPQVALLRC